MPLQSLHASPSSKHCEASCLAICRFLRASSRDRASFEHPDEILQLLFRQVQTIARRVHPLLPEVWELRHIELLQSSRKGGVELRRIEFLREGLRKRAQALREFFLAGTLFRRFGQAGKLLHSLAEL